MVGAPVSTAAAVAVENRRAKVYLCLSKFALLIYLRFMVMNAIRYRVYALLYKLMND
jgi:hypothetical protein